MVFITGFGGDGLPKVLHKFVNSVLFMILKNMPVVALGEHWCGMFKEFLNGAKIDSPHNQTGAEGAPRLANTEKFRIT